jgi:RHS repeat-associated protein
MLRNLILIAALFAAAQVHATTVTLQDGSGGYSGTTDTFLDQSNATQTYGSSPNLGATSSTARVPLVRFKIFAADGGPVPNGATITSATLSLYKGTGSSSTTFEARRLLRDWDEASASWQKATSSVSWTTTGAQGSGDIATSADGQGSASSGQWLSIDVTPSLQSFAGGTANNGWRIAYVGGDGSGNSFRSREASTSIERPKLVIVYASGPPAAPNLGGSVSATTVNLTWNDNSSDETGFKLERKTGAGGTYSQIAAPAANATSYGDAGLAPGTTYYYRIRATNSYGDSAYSNELSRSIGTLPAAPSGLSATLISSNQINLAWTDASSDETSFRIERKTGAGGTYSEIAVRSPGSTSYSNTNLAANTEYFYRVKAVNATGDSAYSNEASARTAGVAAVPSSTVEYAYDPFGNLKSTNAGGAVTTLSYDLRGRKTGMTDPDMGIWTYAYNALGELISQTDARNQVTAMQYDLLGRMTMRTEADLTSRWTYDTYPAAGGDPNWSTGQLNGLSGSCAQGVGKLCYASAGNDYKRVHTYDTLGRPLELKGGADGPYIVRTAYVASGAGLGKVDTLTYPTGFAVKHVYNAVGYLAEVRDNADNALFWQAQTMSAAGGVTQELLGNGLTAVRSYDTLFRLTAASASGGAGTPHSQTFTYDAIGNLSTRTDAVQGITENFYYDSLNRLLVSSGAGLASRFYSYDAIGNITYKSDVGAYTYAGASASLPHAVTSVSGAGAPNSITASYGYDANGSLTSASGTIYPASGSVAFSRTLSYMSFNLPNVLTHVQGGATYSYTYTYSAEHERVRLVTARPDDTLTSIYIHPAGKGALLYEKETRASDGLIEHKHYVNGGAGLIGVYVTKSSYAAGDGPGMRYYHKDHLGNVAVITNAAGAWIERLAYEAFGERRYPSGSPEDRSAPLIGVTTDRGFTAHEHLDEMMLIHMNGRIYDPLLGRFMTPDPFIEAPGNLQSYNRYSYGFNNPLFYTDPSGYSNFFCCNDDSFLGSIGLGGVGHEVTEILQSPAGQIVVAGLAWYGGALIGDWLIAGAADAAGTAGFGSTAFATFSAAEGAVGGSLTALGAAVSGAGAGFVGGFLASGGDLEFALKSGIAVGLTSGLGQLGAELAGTPGSIAGRSLGSGLSSQAFGGNFADGIKNGFLGAVRSEAYGYMQRETDKLASAYWGGRGGLPLDEFRRVWTYGNRGCETGESAPCSTFFPDRLLMRNEQISFAGGLFTETPLVGGGLGNTPFLGAFLNSVSKVHDWLNNALTAVYNTDPASAGYGGGRELGTLRGGIIDAVSSAGMIPAASFAARALYQNPLRR